MQTSTWAAEVWLLGPQVSSWSSTQVPAGRENLTSNFIWAHIFNWRSQQWRSTADLTYIRKTVTEPQESFIAV